jgi:hypothetical protein
MLRKLENSRRRKLRRPKKQKRRITSQKTIQRMRTRIHRSLTPLLNRAKRVLRRKRTIKVKKVVRKAMEKKSQKKISS